MWQALLTQDLATSPVSKALLALRGYGRRALRPNIGTFPEKLERFGFTKLDEVPGRELVFGIAGRFWRPDGGLRRLTDRAAFMAFCEEGCVKAAWNVRIDDAGEEASDLSTETRIQFFGTAPRDKFRLYWALVGPFSGILRRNLLRGIKARAEASFP